MSHQVQDFLLPLDSTFSSLLQEKSEDLKWLGVVCFLIIENHVILIKRSDDMPTHRGQVGLIGGHKKTGESLLEGALREYFEELSLQISPTFLGFLPSVQTTLRNSIVPIVCELSLSLLEFFKKIKSNGEWVELFAVPLKNFYDLNAWGYGRAFQNDSKPIFFFPIKAYTYQGHSGKNDKYHTLWGATAQMMVNFISMVPLEKIEE